MVKRNNNIALDQKEKKTISSGLKTSEDIFKTFFVGANDIIISIDKKSRFICVNQAWSKILGYSQKEARKMSFGDILIGTQKSYWQKALKHIIAGKSIKKYKTIFVTKKGKKIFVEGSISTQKDGGKCIAVWGIFRNISKYKKGEHDLPKMYRSIEERRYGLEAIKSLSDRLTNIFSVEQAISSMNSYLAEVLDFSVATYLVLDPAGEGGFVYTTHIREDVDSTYLKEAGVDIEKFLIKKNNPELKPAIALIKNIKPQIIGIKPKNRVNAKPKSKIIFPLGIGNSVLGIIQITSKKPNLFTDKGWLTDAMIVTFMLFVVRIQTLARSQHSKTESLIEGLSDGVVMFNKKKNIILMNPKSINFTGLTLKSFALVDFYKLFPNLEIDNCVDRMFKTGKIIHIKDAKLLERYYEIFVTPVKDNEEKIVNGAFIMHDITKQKEVEVVKTEFVSFASHQLRTPLTGIKWFSRLLLKNKAGKLNDKQRDFIEQIYMTNSRMIKLVTDLLNVSRIELGRKFNILKKPVTLSFVINKAINEYVLTARNKRVKIVNLSESLGNAKLVVDSGKINQAMGNLISNAIKYSPDGGKIEIDCSPKADKLIISIKDKGIGIPKKQQKNIFNKFFRADNAINFNAKGTGLGLYLAKAIIEAHSGELWFKSIENKGTTFYMSLPI